MTTATDDVRLAYLAGAIDADGTIGIRRSTYAMRKRGDASVPIYSERIALRQVTPMIPQLLQQTFGGSLYITKPSIARGRPLHSWAATDLKAATALVLLRPFLRIKAPQADNAIDLRRVKERSRELMVARGRGHMGSAPRDDNITATMDHLYVQAKELNRVGV